MLSKRDAAWKRSQGKCAYCGEALKDDFTIDHVLPKQIGGSNDKRNLVAACLACNQRKRNKTVEEFRQEVKAKTFWIETLENKKLTGHSKVKWTPITIERI